MAFFPDVYERLRDCKRPICLYGIGNGAEKIYKALSRERIAVDGVFVSDAFVREKQFLGFPVLSLAQAEDRFGDFAAVLCFGLEGEEIPQTLELLQNREHLVFAPAVPVYGEGELSRAYLRAHRETAERIYNWLSDEPSKTQYEALLRYHISGDPSFLTEAGAYETPPQAYYAHELLHLDIGAYDGDTAREYLQNNPHCARIWAFEPDPSTFRRLQQQTDPTRVTCFAMACGERDGESFLSGSGRGSHCDQSGTPIRVCRPDSVCGYPFVGSEGEAVGSMKIDAEGLDAQVLAGSANLITACRPVICVSAYHKAYDLLELPLLLKRLCYRSKLYVRRKACVPAWDTYVYLVPEEGKEAMP